MARAGIGAGRVRRTLRVGRGRRARDRARQRHAEGDRRRRRPVHGCQYRHQHPARWDLGGYQLLSNLVLFIPMLEFYTQRVSTPLTASVLPAPTAAAPVSTARGIVRTGGGAPDASAAPPGEN
ncbi:hypothetical protein [Microbacterium lacticum]